MKRDSAANGSPLKPKRCAIYTRKSTEEGLEQEFNSLDAQHDACAAYIASQRHDGWVCLSNRYDDGGFTGANLDRPAMQRLMADITAGRIDVVTVYKVDRISRSLLDFARLMAIFEQHGVAFVSVTQQFNTSSSMGRLMMNVLLSFAQFEREVIGERTRDKIAATRRKGKWTGGRPPLGYDVDAAGKLVPNAVEAEQVRAIFNMYLEYQSLPPVMRELERRGWKNKSWTMRDGRMHIGLSFSKTALHRLLSSVVYIGRLGYKQEVHPGEHAGIVEETVFEKVGQVLRRNGATGGADQRCRSKALLQGLIRCKPCGYAMCPAFTSKGNRRYRYYICSGAQRKGWDTCPSKSVPAGPLEQLVIDRLRSATRDPEVVGAVFAEARRNAEEQIETLEDERTSLGRELKRWQVEINLLVAADPTVDKGTHLADLHERVATAQMRLAVISDELQTLRARLPDEVQSTAALAAFDPVWEALTPCEQQDLIRQLVERVEYDGAGGNMTLTFHPGGLRNLAEQVGIKELRA